MTALLDPWSDADTADFGRRPTPFRHRLAGHELFSDAALAQLIEASPQDHMHVNTMPRDTDDPHGWREGALGGLAGEKVLEAVARGNIWLHLQRVHETIPAYGDLLDALFDEIETRIPGLHTYKRSMSVLVSSPRMNVAYHSDVPGQSLWQIRGHKRVWIYPDHAPFLPQKTREAIALQRTMDTDLPYDAAFDAEAVSYRLEPGDWAHWPRNAPHRVVNEDCVNVSFTTEHWTADHRNAYAMDYANGLLRPFLGDRDLPRDPQGPAFLAKLALAGAHKTVRNVFARKMPLTIDFHVDPGAAEGFSDVTPYRIYK